MYYLERTHYRDFNSPDLPSHINSLVAKCSDYDCRKALSGYFLKLEKDTSGYEDFKSPLLTKKELNNTLFSIIFYYVSYGFFNSRLNTVDILQSFLDISDVFVEIAKTNALTLENISLPYLRKYFLVEFQNLDTVLKNLDVALSDYKTNVSETAEEDQSLVEFTKKNHLALFFATWLAENSENNEFISLPVEWQIDIVLNSLSNELMPSVSEKPKSRGNKNG